MYNKYFLYYIIIIFLNIDIILSIEYLSKYGSIEVDGTQNKFIVFDSSGPSTTFYFKFSSSSHCENGITYQYEDYIDTSNTNKYNNLRRYSAKKWSSSEVIDGYTYTINYYDIEKSYILGGIGEGKNLIIGFNYEGIVKIENTKKRLYPKSIDLDSGTIVGICFCGLVFIILIFLIILSCYDCKKKLSRSSITSSERPFQVENNVVPISYNYFPNPISVSGNIQ